MGRGFHSNNNQKVFYCRFFQELRGGDWGVDAINVFSDEILANLEKLVNSSLLSDMSAIIIAFGMHHLRIRKSFHENAFKTSFCA